MSNTQTHTQPHKRSESVIKKWVVEVALTAFILRVLKEQEACTELSQYYVKHVISCHSLHILGQVSAIQQRDISPI
jgi:hypothetical protein